MVISLANGKARQRKNILIVGAEQNPQDADDNNHPYATGKLCMVRSAYVLLTTGAAVVSSFPGLSLEAVTLCTLSSVPSSFVFPGGMAEEVSKDGTAVLSVTLSLAGSVDSVAAS